MALSAYLQHGRAGEPMRTESVPVRESVMGWQAAGLTWTASGYGARIATRYMVQVDGRWRRIYRDQSDRYAPQSFYIGRNLETGTCITLQGAS